MEFLNIVSINWTVLIAIIGLSEYFKKYLKTLKILKENKFFNFIFPFVFSGLAAYLMNMEAWLKMFYDWFIYMGFSVLIYEIVIKSFKNLLEKVINKEEISKTGTNAEGH
ncbi:MAG: hypothetical protein GF311_28335 [Candidatus Lokiarchaeota archaeon]|nr:hypothetical protein [Candidatus Lokiarchaeota archaeon]